ncbi:MAG: PAS domain S-box protein [Chloroflexi bacterium]|nr:MAG: PAS domain S-box protein [Chloroflexota bacterium]
MKPKERLAEVAWLLDRTTTAEHLLLLFDTIDELAVYMLDIDGRVQTWNRGAEQVKGYRAEQILGRHFECFYPPEDVERGKPDQELAVAAATGRFEDEGWRVRMDGSRYWANEVVTALRGEDGRLIGFGKVTRDLTDRQRAEDQLRESEERFRLLVNAPGYAIYMLDPEGRVASWSEGAERLKGYRADEIIGQHFSRFYPPDEVRDGKPHRELEIATQKGRIEHEGWRVRKDGTRFWANVVITALRGADGSLRGFGKITQDLTERKLAEDALRGVLERERETTEQLRELDRLKTDFVAIVAHDLRSPLSVIAGYADLLLGSADRLSEERKQECLERIFRGTLMLSALVDDVLEVARIESGRIDFNFAPVDVAALVTAAAGHLGNAVNSGRVDVDARPDVPLALADEQRLSQVLLNLLSNALKFSPDGSPVEVGIRRDGPDVRIQVQDHGPGIEPEDQPKLFQRFTRLRRATEDGIPGTGLGLYISKSFVEAHHGRIWVESTPGLGATFIVTIPSASEGD